jgi:hypothetical protein
MAFPQDGHLNSFMLTSSLHHEGEKPERSVCGPAGLIRNADLAKQALLFNAKHRGLFRNRGGRARRAHMTSLWRISNTIVRYCLCINSHYFAIYAILPTSFTYYASLSSFSRRYINIIVIRIFLYSGTCLY